MGQFRDKTLRTETRVFTNFTSLRATLDKHLVSLSPMEPWNLVFHVHRYITYLEPDESTPCA
jgi:hypothetical protein